MSILDAFLYLSDKTCQTALDQSFFNKSFRVTVYSIVFTQCIYIADVDCKQKRTPGNPVLASATLYPLASVLDTPAPKQHGLAHMVSGLERRHHTPPEHAPRRAGI